MDLRKTFAAVALALCLLPFAAAAPLLDPDEGLHAAIAQEMVQRHDYVTPTYLGQPFLDKPILFFWAEAFSLRAFGMDEAAVRVPPAFFGLLGMLGVALLGAAMLGRETGLFAGIVYGTMLLPAALMHIAVHDIALTPFLCAAAWGIWRCATTTDRTPGSVAGQGAIVGLALGLSILTKGLVGVAFAGLFTLVLIAWRRDAVPALAAMLAVAGIVMVAVALPWYLLMERAHPGYLHYYFVERHLQGYLTATQRHGGRPWWYYLPILVGGALPWTGFVPAAVRLRTVPHRLLWAWFAGGVVFLSIGESKLATYVLPAIPALAILLASAIERAHDGDRLHTAGLVVHGISLSLLPAMVLVAVGIRYGEFPWIAWVGAVSAGALVAILCVRAARRAPVAAQLSRLAATAVLGLFATVVIAAPEATPWMTARDLADTLNSGGVLPPKLLVLDERIGSLVFYLAPALRAEASPQRIDEVSMAGVIDETRGNPSEWLLAARSRAEPRLRKLLGQDLQPDARAGTFLVYRASTLRRALAAR